MKKTTEEKNKGNTRPRPDGGVKIKKKKTEEKKRVLLDPS